MISNEWGRDSKLGEYGKDCRQATTATHLAADRSDSVFALLSVLGMVLGVGLLVIMVVFNVWHQVFAG